MKPIAVAIILSLLSAGGALAADVELPASLPASRPIYPVAAPIDWSGIYFGINGGYGFGNSNWTNAGLSTGNFNTNGFLLGGTLGVNYMTGGGFIFGLETDFDWSTNNGTSSTAACAGLGAALGEGCASRSDWLSTARGRAGYAFNRFFIYGTAGAAIADVKVGLNPGIFQPWGHSSGGLAVAASSLPLPIVGRPSSNTFTRILVPFPVRRLAAADPHQTPRLRSKRTSSAAASTTNLRGDLGRGLIKSRSGALRGHPIRGSSPILSKINPPATSRKDHGVYSAGQRATARHCEPLMPRLQSH